MGPTNSPERSALNQPTMRNNPENGKLSSRAAEAYDLATDKVVENAICDKQYRLQDRYIGQVLQKTWV